MACRRHDVFKERSDCLRGVKGVGVYPEVDFWVKMGFERPFMVPLWDMWQITDTSELYFADMPVRMCQRFSCLEYYKRARGQSGNDRKWGIHTKFQKFILTQLTLKSFFLMPSSGCCW